MKAFWLKLRAYLGYPKKTSAPYRYGGPKNRGDQKISFPAYRYDYNDPKVQREWKDTQIRRDWDMRFSLQHKFPKKDRPPFHVWSTLSQNFTAFWERLDRPTIPRKVTRKK